MNAEEKQQIQQEILYLFPGTNPDWDIDWEIIEIAFNRGFDVGLGYSLDVAKAPGTNAGSEAAGGESGS